MVKPNKSFAALLNFFIWGAGYLYKGKRKEFGWLFIIAYLFIHLTWFMPFGMMSWAFMMPGMWIVVGHLFISIALAYDCYNG